MNVDLDKARAEARKEAIGYVGECVCHEAWTSRKLIDPNCGWHLIEGLPEDIITAAYPHVFAAVVEALRARAEEEFGGPEFDGADVSYPDPARWLAQIAQEGPDA